MFNKLWGREKNQYGTVAFIIASASIDASKYGPKIYISLADESSRKTLRLESLYMPREPGAEKTS